MLTIIILIEIAYVLWAARIFINGRKEFKEHKKFIDKRGKDWNDYIDELLMKSKSEEETEYILTHFKRFNL